jgi:hypothetical protein
MPFDAISRREKALRRPSMSVIVLCGKPKSCAFRSCTFLYRDETHGVSVLVMLAGIPNIHLFFSIDHFREVCTRGDYSLPVYTLLGLASGLVFSFRCSVLFRIAFRSTIMTYGVSMFRSLAWTIWSL